MPDSALALGHAGLRLRPRRSRADRSHRLSVWFVAASVVLAGVIGAVASSIRPDSLTVVDAAVLDVQRFHAAFLPIHSSVQATTLRIGVIAAEYATGAMDAADFQLRLHGELAALRAADAELERVQAPGELAPALRDYVGALRLFESSTNELLLAPGDGARVSAAIAMSLEASRRMRAATDQLWPSAMSSSSRGVDAR